MIQAGNHSPREARGRRRTWLPWLVGLLGLGLSVAGFWMLRNLEKRNHQLLAEDEAGARGAAVVAAVGTATSVLRSAKAVFDSSHLPLRSLIASGKVQQASLAHSLWHARVPG